MKLKKVILDWLIWRKKREHNLNNVFMGCTVPKEIFHIISSKIYFWISKFKTKKIKNKNWTGHLNH